LAHALEAAAAVRRAKSMSQQKFLVCGSAERKGSRSKNFGALPLAEYQDGRLRYFGHSGSGFSGKRLQEALPRRKPLFIDKAPVENPPKTPERIQWVEPKLVCEVAFAEWTLDGELRRRRSWDVSVCPTASSE
jgi:bifunctional non-homologous end joining protein LigD